MDFCPKEAFFYISIAKLSRTTPNSVQITGLHDAKETLIGEWPCSQVPVWSHTTPEPGSGTIL